MINDATIYDAVCFTGSALVLMLIAFLFGSQRRRGLLPMVIVSVTGLVILWGAMHVPHLLDSRLTAVLIREVAFALVAIGFMRVAILFVLQTLLARRGIPRILDDLLITLALAAYAIYRLEWQAVGSLQRRLRNCMSGMRAETYDFGAPELVDLEYYLMWRARGMAMEAPAVRP